METETNFLNSVSHRNGRRISASFIYLVWKRIFRAADFFCAIGLGRFTGRLDDFHRRQPQLPRRAIGRLARYRFNEIQCRRPCRVDFLFSQWFKLRAFVPKINQRHFSSPPAITPVAKWPCSQIPAPHSCARPSRAWPPCWQC